MSQTPVNNGWRLIGKCIKCGYLGSSRLVCPSCGDRVPAKKCEVVARWVSTRKWWHVFMIEMGTGGYWEEKK